MSGETKHITPNSVYLWVLIGLLVLTALTVTVTWIDLSAFTVLVALVIATVKATIVLTYFMHLKYESRLFRVFVVMVLAIYTLVILGTFVDYLAR
jgi:cytochrome c oxidase subunit IV